IHLTALVVCFQTIRPPPSPTLLPSTTLFRSSAELPWNMPSDPPSNGMKAVITTSPPHLFALFYTNLHFTEKRRTRQVEARFFPEDRKSTRLNSSHVKTSYAVFCLKKKMYCYH